MKRMIFTGILAVATGLAALAAQQKAPAQATPPAAATPAQPKGPTAKSTAEAQAYTAMQQASQSNNPDAIIKAADDLLTKFADTDFKEIALSLEARAYQMKNDGEHAMVYAQQVLAINPKSYQMTLLLGEVMSTRIGEHDLDRDQKMTTATKYLNDTIDLVKTAPKPNPAITDEQWAEYQKDTTAEAHNGLGMLALVRKDWPTAIAEYKTATEGDPQDAYFTRLASAYQQSGKNDEAIAVCDKLLAKPDLHPVIKRVVTQIKDAATAAKGKK